MSRYDGCICGPTLRALGLHSERCDIARLGAAVDLLEKNHPLPRCAHGNALRDHAGDTLEPSCGCKRAKGGG